MSDPSALLPAPPETPSAPLPPWERLHHAWDALTRWGKAQAGPLGAALVGLLTFLATFGPGALAPWRLGWLIRDDFSQHLLGWLFFRQTPLGLPLGATPNYLHPLGTSLGYTDSIPWVGLLLRPFSFALPTDFQYIGPWMCLCLMLQGASAAWVARRMGASTQHQWCVGGLLVLSPVLLSRMTFAHEALCAHWLLVLLVGLHLIPQRDARDAKQALGMGLSLCVFAAGVHPVIAAMTLPLALSLCARTALERKFPFTWPALAAVACFASVLGLFFAFGYLGTGIPVSATEFGDYSSDLTTLFNSIGHGEIRWSRFLPPLPRNGSQNEGFGYLGMGGLVALVIVLGLMAREPRRILSLWRRWVPLTVVALGLAFFALSWRITFQGVQVADVSALYRPVLKWVEAFRSSGRFIWPLHYLLLVGAALALPRLVRPSLAPTLAGLLLLIQGLDLNLGEGRRAHGGGGRWNTLPSPALSEAAKGRKHLALYPPQMHDGSGRGCRAGPMDFHRWAYRAYRLGLTFNSGYVARIDDAKAQTYCLGMDAEIAAGKLDPETVYLVIPVRVRWLQKIPGAHCTPEDGLWLCVYNEPPASSVSGR
ncbi:hypothetical protein HUA78_33240 [Myxococcus sp. CA033]|uniref:DUF6311 domain-containing protein n=1 Tax=Myxococcus sp. CA033 TaxID=2741516 RepID=UPI00157B2C3C|nr:DUF6311 domain-containing protein [Myxococcus sp. CA033]NTX39311.1 hypothetical protein [Myxococcus sp. CA033]